MGIYDREYYREEGERTFLDGGLVGDVRWPIMVITAFAYLLDLATFKLGGIAVHLALSSEYALQLWRYFTYALVEPAGPMILLFHLYCLWVFGGLVQQMRPPRELLAVYLVGLAATGGVFVFLSWLSEQPDWLLGCVPGVLAVATLGIFYLPKEPCTLIFFQVESRWLYLIFVGITLHQQFQVNPAGLPTLALLVAPLLGLLYGIQRWHLTGWIDGSWFRGWRMPRRRRRGESATIRFPATHARDDTPPPTMRPDEPGDETERVDQILEKIHRLGQASLTEEEKAVLARASERSRRRRGLS